MRILLLARTLTVGGVEPHMATLGKGLMGLGCTVAIASDGGIGNHAHGADWFEQAGLRHYTVPFPAPGRPLSSSRKAIATVPAIVAVVRQFRPDLIHIHYRAVSVYAKLVELLQGVPFVSTLHLTGIPADASHRAVSLWGKRVIAISTEVQEYLKTAFRIRPERIRLIYNGVDDVYFRPPTPEEKHDARRQLGIPEGARVVSMVARMSPHKAQDVLVRAVADLRSRGREIVALLAGVSIEGDNTWHNEVQNQVDRLGLTQHVRLLGFAESRTVFWASDASVLPSRQEGFPLSVLESMLCGVVPIRTPAAGAREQISDGVDGYLIPFDDSTALANRVDDVLYGDPLRRSSMERAALDKARQHFSASGMVSRTLAVYEEALDLRPPAFISSRESSRS